MANSETVKCGPQKEGQHGMTSTSSTDLNLVREWDLSLILPPRTPWQLACEKGHFQVVRVLLQTRGQKSGSEMPVL